VKQEATQTVARPWQESPLFKAGARQSYIWSEVLDADTVQWFTENGGLRRASGDTFRRALLSRGGSVDPMTAFAAFRGRPPRIEPLLERRGLTRPT
jgi:peptidyl-dipeptidase Dcp